MNQALIGNLKQLRTEMTVEMLKLKTTIEAIDCLLDEHIPDGMVRGVNRRRGGTGQVQEALSEIGRGSIRDIADKVSKMFPGVDGYSILSKTATYLKRLHEAGEIQAIKEKGKLIYITTPTKEEQP